jgi:hypothetical protein
MMFQSDAERWDYIHTKTERILALIDELRPFFEDIDRRLKRLERGGNEVLMRCEDCGRVTQVEGDDDPVEPPICRICASPNLVPLA